jgi:enoyl-CoA hydratase/carnithine racemase
LRREERDAISGGMSDYVRTAIEGRIGRLILDRPRALNALDAGMIDALSAALAAWRDDPAIHAAVIEGSERAFCAGGDIRAVRDAALAGDAAAIESFFAREYALNLAIATWPKPYVALVDGICMGGGIGLSVHGAYRVATEHAVFAMPETGIALFPDVGASYVLPRLPGALGMFLGLTGTRVTGADAVHAGFATHFVPRAALAGLRTALAQNGVAALGAATLAPGPFSLAPHLAAIDRCFSAPALPEILARLRDEGAWGAATLATLRAMSPSALHWSFDIIHAGSGRELAACLAAELALTRVVTRHPDFVEGVRAMVVDKDRSPRWAASRLWDEGEQIQPGVELA